MTTYYVRTTGSDSNAGTSAGAAWLTIGKAATTLANGDTAWIGAGTYRISSTIAPGNRGAMTYLYGDTDGSHTGDAGEVVVTNYATNDTTAPTNITLFTLASKSYWTIGRMSLVAGTNGAVSITGTSGHIELADLSVWTLGSGSAIYVSPNFGVSPAVGVRRCRVLAQSGSCVSFFCGSSATGADYDLASVIEDCVLLSWVAWACVSGSGTANTYRAGGVTVANCVLAAYSASVYTANAYWSTTYPIRVYNSLVLTGLNANVSGHIVEDYNVIAGSRTNVTAGSNSISNGSRNWRFSLGHEGSFGGVTRPWGEFVTGSPLLNWGGTSVPSTDIRGVARPASGSGQSSTQQALGPYERRNSGTRDDSVYHTAAPSVKVSGPGYHEIDCAVDGGHATTITAWVRWDGSYTGTKPSISVVNGGEAGVSDATATATGSASTWEQLSVGPFTPTASGVVTLRFTSSDTSGAGGAWIDDLQAT